MGNAQPYHQFLIDKGTFYEAAAEEYKLILQKAIDRDMEKERFGKTKKMEKRRVKYGKIGVACNEELSLEIFGNSNLCSKDIDAAES